MEKITVETVGTPQVETTHRMLKAKWNCQKSVKLTKTQDIGTSRTRWLLLSLCILAFNEPRMPYAGEAA